MSPKFDCSFKFAGNSSFLVFRNFVVVFRELGLLAQCRQDWVPDIGFVRLALQLANKLLHLYFGSQLHQEVEEVQVRVVKESLPVDEEFSIDE